MGDPSRDLPKFLKLQLQGSENLTLVVPPVFLGLLYLPFLVNSLFTNTLTLTLSSFLELNTSLFKYSLLGQLVGDIGNPRQRALASRRSVLQLAE